MNKIIFVIIVVLLGSCNTSKTTLDIDYVDINEDIFIRLNSEKDKVISIDYPIGIIFKNVKNQNLSFSSIDHWDFDNKSLKASLLYSKYYNSLKRISKEKYKKIDNNKYILYTQQSIDTSNVVQEVFSSYFRPKEIKNRINIGSIINFKQNNPELIRKIIEGDSLYVLIKQKDDKKLLKFPLLK